VKGSKLLTLCNNKVKDKEKEIDRLKSTLESLYNKKTVYCTNSAIHSYVYDSYISLYNKAKRHSKIETECNKNLNYSTAYSSSKIKGSYEGYKNPKNGFGYNKLIGKLVVDGRTK